MESSTNLLRTLEQLNDSAWADTLIPKLKSNGSAGSFALTCKQLRQLCHGTQHKLRLKGTDCSHEVAIAQIPQHFPSCTEVEFTVEDCEDAGVNLSAALAEFARLQHLTKLYLRVTDSDAASDPTLLAPVLELVRLQLPGLRCLELSVNTSWAVSSSAWRVLGRATQLTELALMFAEEVEDAATLEHLSALSRLSNLSHLKVEAGYMEPQQDYSWLQHLTRLTFLDLPLVEQHEGLASIGSCTDLRELRFNVMDESAFSEGECAAIAQLVQLTRLNARVDDAGANPHFLSALRGLSQLEWLLVEGLSPASLPCLAGLSKLTELRGAWQAGDIRTGASGAQEVCGGIARLGGEGLVPFAAFPNLEHCFQWDTWEPATLKALAVNCKQLEGLRQSQQFPSASLSSDFPVGERIVAIQALAALQHMTLLHFRANDDAELAAVAAIKQLKSLSVAVPASSGCTGMGLQLLLLLQGLQFLSLELHSLSMSQQEAQSLMCGMQHVKWLCVLASSQQVHLYKAALGSARAAQLSVPARVTFGPLPCPLP